MCHLCNKTFAQKPNLLRHMKKLHYNHTEGSTGASSANDVDVSSNPTEKLAVVNTSLNLVKTDPSLEVGSVI